MKIRIVVLAFFILFAVSAETASAAENFILNPTFETIKANGDPESWLRGGYGQNTRSYGVHSCEYYTEEDLLNDVNSPDFIFRPDCPPNARFRLSTNVSNYVNGDSKWYFADVAIGSNKNLVLSYQYQAYNSRSRVIARYAFPNGTFQYQFLSEMPPLITLGMGYVSWIKAEREFIAPAGAISLTIFFAVGEEGLQCTFCGSDRGGALSIANVVLKQKSSVSTANLIQNPSFETDGGTGNPQSWLRGGWGTNTRAFTYPVFGADNSSAFFFDKKATKVEITSYTSGDAKWYSKDVPVTGGATYIFSDIYKSDIPSEIGVMYKVSAGTRYQFLTSLPAVADWTPVTRSINVPENATGLTIFHTIYRVGSLEVDEYSLTSVN